MGCPSSKVVATPAPVPAEQDAKLAEELQQKQAEVERRLRDVEKREALLKEERAEMLGWLSLMEQVSLVAAAKQRQAPSRNWRRSFTAKNFETAYDVLVRVDDDMTR
ncbi:unnamed protein product [Durusdinium trenchii]|uniref:Uncharacterized protein n=1 Tax=Durusdinium trenchii TaxID=1381693 RepID=A0ABP0MV00_9DINO